MFLYIGNKNYSSWSLRAWLCAKYAGLDFEEVVIPIRTLESEQQISAISPSKKVPCLHHKGLIIWDSLAIAEYANELNPSAELLPKDQAKRALARSIVCEMHSGFLDLRKEFPMNMKLKKPIAPSADARKNIDRILEVWQNCRSKFSSEGEFLLGKFSIVDAFFAPIVSRFVSYEIDVGANQKYLESVINIPLYQEWLKSARAEKWVIEGFEK